MTDSAGSIAVWVAAVLERQTAAADCALQRLRAKPHSRKRVHAARKELARLLTTAEDFCASVGDGALPYDRIRALHKRLGRVRDADVHLQRLHEYRKDAAIPERAEQRAARRFIRKRRRKARRKLAALMTQPRIRVES